MTNAYAVHHADFLQQFVANEQKKRQKPTPLTAKEHAKNRLQLRSVKLMKPKYATETKVNIVGICKKWTRYCAEMELGDWKTTLKNLTRDITMDFVHFICERYSIVSSGTSAEYIRQFQMLYTTVTGQYMNRNDSKEVYNYHNNVLVPHFELRAPNIDGKPVLNVDSLCAILSFNLAYDSATFELERHRLQLAACYQILCYTGARPAELVHAERKPPKGGSVEALFANKAVRLAEEGDDSSVEISDKLSDTLEGLLLEEDKQRGRPKALCYEDIMMMLVRHPDTGKAIPVMAIRFAHHKGADRKPKPTVFYFTPSKKVIFCAVTSVIALALHDEAFDGSNLVNATSILRDAKIPGQMQSIPLRWKQSRLKCPVFRQIQRGVLSDDKAMSYSKLNYDMGRQSLDAGFEKPWTPRFARRGAANAADGDAPDTVRDQLMRHDPRFVTFFNSYLNENARFDLQNAFLEEEKQDKLFKMFAFVSLTRDPRAVRNMVPAKVWETTPPDPVIEELEAERAALKQDGYRIDGNPNEGRIRKLTRTIRTKRAEREKQIVKQYREYYFYHKPTWDIEAQARGDEEEEFEQPSIDVAIPERARLAQIFCHQSIGLNEEEILTLRIEAIDLMVSLCDKRETPKGSNSRQATRIGSPIKQESPEPEPEPELDGGLSDFPLLLDATQCPDCIGDDRLPPKERTFRWCRTTVRNNHFDDQHLPARESIEKSKGSIRCFHPKCKETVFLHLDHFRSHVFTVHGVSLRTSQQVEQRRLRKVKRRQMAARR